MSGFAAPVVPSYSARGGSPGYFSTAHCRHRRSNETTTKDGKRHHQPRLRSPHHNASLTVTSSLVLPGRHPYFLILSLSITWPGSPFRTRNVGPPGCLAARDSLGDPLPDPDPETSQSTDPPFDETIIITAMAAPNSSIRPPRLFPSADYPEPTLRPKPPATNRVSRATPPCISTQFTNQTAQTSPLYDNCPLYLLANLRDRRFRSPTRLGRCGMGCHVG